MIVQFSPLPGNTPHNRQFRTHLGYQRAFRALAFDGQLRTRHRHLPELADRALAAYGTSVKPKTVTPDVEDVIRTCLRRSWGAETILCVTAELSPDAEMTRLALAWGSVQTYYACYAAVQTNLVAEGNPISDQHNTTQKQAADFWATRSFSLAPWSLAAVDPSHKLCNSPGFLNGPGRPLNPAVHAWANLTPGDEWDLAGAAVRSTREASVTRAVKKAREQKKKDRARAWRDEEAVRLAAGKRARKTPDFALPQLTAAEKDTVGRSVRPYTLLDYLFRLRIKANYLDDDMFSEGPDDDGAAESFASGMLDIAATTLLVHELRLGKMLGSKWVLREVDAWLATRTGAPSTSGVAARRAILAGA